MIKEEQVKRVLSSDKEIFSPLDIKNYMDGARLITEDGSIEIDGILQLQYLGRNYEVILEILYNSTPKAAEEGIRKLLRMKNQVSDGNKIFAIVLPYLSKKVAELLEQKGVSGFDLNGNYFIKEKQLLAIRLDRKNQYAEKRYIKNIYRDNSSLVGRFLLRKNRQHDTISEISEEIQNGAGKITISTVSKVLIEMEKDLLVSRDKNRVKLLQPKELLSKLAAEYRPPRSGLEYRLKLPADRGEIEAIFNYEFRDNWMWSGESSADIYLGNPPLNDWKVYVKTDNGTIPIEFLQKYEDKKFYNCRMQNILAVEEFIFFDRAEQNLSSRIQSYLEMYNLDKREKELAQKIEWQILDEFNRK